MFKEKVITWIIIVFPYYLHIVIFQTILVDWMKKTENCFCNRDHQNPLLEDSSQLCSLSNYQLASRSHLPLEVLRLVILYLL